MPWFLPVQACRSSRARPGLTEFLGISEDAYSKSLGFKHLSPQMLGKWGTGRGLLTGDKQQGVSIRVRPLSLEHEFFMAGGRLSLPGFQVAGVNPGPPGPFPVRASLGSKVGIVPSSARSVPGGSSGQALLSSPVSASPGTGTNPAKPPRPGRLPRSGPAGRRCGWAVGSRRPCRDCRSCRCHGWWHGRSRPQAVHRAAPSTSRKVLLSPRHSARKLPPPSPGRCRAGARPSLSQQRPTTVPCCDRSSGALAGCGVPPQLRGAGLRGLAGRLVEGKGARAGGRLGRPRMREAWTETQLPRQARWEGTGVTGARLVRGPLTF